MADSIQFIMKNLRKAADKGTAVYFAPDAVDTLEAALAQPAPPAEGDVAELVAAVQAAYSAYGWVEVQQFVRLFDEAARLASVIEEGCDCSVGGPMNWRVEIERFCQHSQIQPVPISERLPGPEDCVSNPRTGSGQWCWGWVLHDPSVTYSGRWRMMRREWLASEAVAWLPAHALPIPSVGGSDD